MTSQPAPPPSPQFSALRLQRLQLAHYLRIIASQQARIEELENEHAQLEHIIAAQSREISALRSSARPVAAASDSPQPAPAR